MRSSVLSLRFTPPDFGRQGRPALYHMSEPTPASKPSLPKKLSRKDVTQLGRGELWALTKQTQLKLYRYMKPYRGRFMLGIALGIFAGLFNAVMLWGFQIVFALVLTPAPKPAVYPAMPKDASTAVVTAASTSNVHLGAPGHVVPGVPVVPLSYQTTLVHVGELAGEDTKNAKEKQGGKPFSFFGGKEEATKKKEYGDVVLPFIGKVNPVKWMLGTNHKPLTLPYVIAICAVIPLLIFMRGMITYLANYSMIWVGNRVLFDLRNDVYRNILNQSLSFFNRAKVGDLIQTVFNQTRVAQTNAVQLSQVLIQRPIAIMVIFIYLFFWDPFFTISSVLIFPLCIAPIMYVSRRVRASGSKEEEEAGAMMVTMHESFAGVRVVKAYAREDYEVTRFNRANKSMADNIMRWQKALEIIGPIVETVASLGIAAGLVYAWKKGMKVEDFFLLVMALTQIYPHTKELSRVQILIQKCIVATSAVFASMEQKPEVQDAEDATALSRVKGAVKFRNVTFAYTDPKGNKLKKPAVRNINLRLEPGKFYALVGPSGAGKSTLFALLLRYYDLDRGSIVIDGKDIRDVTQDSLRNNIGVVSQDTFLFHDTIKENIRYGKLKSTDEQIVSAAKKAYADEFIMATQGQYEAVVGDSGANLSGGQKQRVSIARAILRNAPILLLDEATSALDTESERHIQDAIQTLSKGKTVVAIAHRLSTVLEADQIVVMENGRVLDVGPHGDLLQRCELYQRLYQLQFKSGEIDPNVVTDDIKIDLTQPAESAALEIASEG